MSQPYKTERTAIDVAKYTESCRIPIGGIRAKDN